MTNQVDESGAAALPHDTGASAAAPTQDDCNCTNSWFRSSDDVRDGYVRGIGFDVKPVKYSVIGDVAIFEGDIALGTAEMMQTIRDEVDSSQTSPYLASTKSVLSLDGITITGKRYLWPKRIVPWVSTPALRELVLKAIKHWETHTIIRFVERTPDNEKEHKNWVSFEALDGCYSSVGMQGGMQVISLGEGCGFTQAVHEIGHAVGLWHEQSREDRDQNVKIVWANVKKGREHNFNQHIVDGDDVGSYDFASIMHYAANAFSTNGKPTIVPMNGQTIAPGNGLSPGDIAAVRALYS